ncbi:hypothetical protein HPB47_020370 [Ixodes persulcatus]|uniref:Uncharacterized protein n=1 Tax=Ixodes persulcatus TaxID=34615 RepID=A0AC60QFJ2_IXOPE|nr:hypothetical protein HPB47_020370 [Ixodes persulcatus]
MDAAFLAIDTAIAAQICLRSPTPLQTPYQVRYLDRSNQLALDATSSEVRDALLKVTHIPIGTQQISVQAYEAIRRGQIRGFIKNAGGLDTAQLLRNLHCRECASLQARPLGNSGSALITFDGTSLPFRVGLGSFTGCVHPFRRQTQVCDTCHRIGHRSAQCPNNTQARCSTCGTPKHGVDACPSVQPKCRNCGGAHLATARSCPKRQGIQLAMAQRDRGRTRRRQSPSSTSKEEPATPPAVPETLALAQPAVPPAAPQVPIAAPRSAKQKTDSCRVLTVKPRAPAGNTTGDRTQVPTSEPLPPTFAEEPIRIDSPFTLHELEAALDRANTSSAPGPDNITVGQIRYLPKALKETVLAEINQATVFSSTGYPPIAIFPVMKGLTDLRALNFSPRKPGPRLLFCHRSSHPAPFRTLTKPGRSCKCIPNFNNITIMGRHRNAYAREVIEALAIEDSGQMGWLFGADELGLPIPTLESLRRGWVTSRRRPILPGRWGRSPSYCGVSQSRLLGCCYAGRSLRLECPLDLLADNFGDRQRSRLVVSRQELPEFFSDDVADDFPKAVDTGGAQVQTGSCDGWSSRHAGEYTTAGAAGVCAWFAIVVFFGLGLSNSWPYSGSSPLMRRLVRVSGSAESCLLTALGIGLALRALGGERCTGMRYPAPPPKCHE